MDAILEYLKKYWLVLVALVLGIVLGLVYGWLINPVQYEDTYPGSLIEAEKVEYLRQSIEAFAYNGDVAKAQKRYNALLDSKEGVLAQIEADPQNIPPELITAFKIAVAPELVEAPGEVVGTPPADATEAPPDTEGSKTRSWLVGILAVFCVLALVVAGVFFYFFILRGRQVSGEPTPAMEAQEAARQAAWTDYTSTGAEPPIAQFMASYKIGDDLFDDSFSVDSPVGEFLGECGVGISDSIGVGDPKKVSAFEVWLFDKNDIQTVTKVVMSEHAFRDPAVRQRLEAKGEPVLAEPGSEAVLETQTLQMVARVVDMGYGADSSLPSESFFDNLILELAVWPK